jgi:hypothetical protein
MERLSLREAAVRTARSVTTLRRYVRGGRLAAEKLPGRFGPEYFVTWADLEAAGLSANGTPAARSEPAGGALAISGAGAHLVPSAPLERVLRETVPVSLFQDLQMKHEQLLVQYGMVRAGGLRVLEMQSELDARRRQLEESQAETARVKERVAREAGELRKRLREADLELEGRRVEAAALREKVRALEMLTRNSVTNEAIERQFADVMEQVRRVDRMSAEHEAIEPGSPWPTRGAAPDPDH